MAATKDVKTAEALLKFLTAPEAAAVLKAKGMEPPIKYDQLGHDAD